MDRSVIRMSSLAAVLLAACTVEPREIFVEPPPLDAGPDRDAGVVDAGGSCLFGEVTCADGFYCDPDGVCQVIPTRCAATADCVLGAVCDRPLVDSSTTTPGRCSARPGACSSNAGCDERCMGVGICGPPADRFVVRGGRPSLVWACTDSRDCGPRSVCRGGACGVCQIDADCPRRLTCTDGACAEANSCLSDNNCYEGHDCGAGAVCVRATEGCTTDPSNDDVSQAVLLTDGYYGDLSICGNDTDWYEASIPHLSGAFITITSTSSYATLDVEVLAGSVIGDRLRRIDLPGVVVLAIPQVVLTEDAVEPFRFSVSTLDRSAPYQINVQLDPFGCADELDLYGDTENILRGPPNQSFELVGCVGEKDRFTIDATASDVVLASASWGGGAMDLDLALFDDAGLQVTPTETSPSVAVEIVSTMPLVRDTPLLVEGTPKHPPFSGQPYTLSVNRDLGSRQAACEAPTPIVLSNNQATVTGDFTGGSNLGRPTCLPDPDCNPNRSNCELFALFERRDRIFRLDPVMTPAVLIATVRPLGNAPVRVSLAVLSTCDDDLSDLGCNSAALIRRPTTLEHVLDTPAPVFVMVSSDGTVEDFAFELDVTLEPIVTPPNDICFDAIDLPISGTQVVSTYGAANDDQLLENSPVCGSAGTGAGGERFYRMTLVANERAALELTGPRGAFLWAGRACTQMTSTCTTAEDLSFGNPVAKARFEPGTDQTFYVAVDGLDRDVVGRYSLRAVREPEVQCLDDGDCTAPLRCDDYACRPVPANDNCPGTSVTLDVNNFARIVGSTGAANDTQTLSCAGSGESDVVYAVTLAAGFSDVSFRLVEANFDAAIAVRPNVCTPTAAERCNDDVRLPDVLLPEVRIESPDAGVYYVIVDAFAGEGIFTLEIEATP